MLGLLDSYFDPGLVEVGLLLGTSLVEVGPDPLLVVLGALLGPDLLDPVLLEVGLLVVVHEDGVGNPGPVEVGLLLGPGLVASLDGLLCGTICTCERHYCAIVVGLCQPGIG